MKQIHLSIFVLVIGAFVFSACGGGSAGLTSDKVIQAFKDAGLEAEDTRALTKDDYGPAPYVCTGTRFFIPSLGADQGGRLFVCDNTTDRDSLKNYYDEMGKSSALFFSWAFVRDNVVVQINGNLPEETARKYESALNDAK